MRCDPVKRLGTHIDQIKHHTDSEGASETGRGMNMAGNAVHPMLTVRVTVMVKLIGHIRDGQMLGPR
jgi:hypothetical protein